MRPRLEVEIRPRRRVRPRRRPHVRARQGEDRIDGARRIAAGLPRRRAIEAPQLLDGRQPPAAAVVDPQGLAVGLRLVPVESTAVVAAGPLERGPGVPQQNADQESRGARQDDPDRPGITPRSEGPFPPRLAAVRPATCPITNPNAQSPAPTAAKSASRPTCSFIRSSGSPQAVSALAEPSGDGVCA